MKKYKTILKRVVFLFRKEVISLDKDKNPNREKAYTIYEEYEIQFAWNKENSSVSAMSKAMKTLSDMLKQFEEMIHKDWDLISEEQRLKVEMLKSKVSSIKSDELDDNELKIVVDYGDGSDNS